jgi:hypothetical protein
MPAPALGSRPDAADYRGVEHWSRRGYPPPETFNDWDLLVALTADWDLHADSVRYVPKGAGSYDWLIPDRGPPRYFVTVDDLDTKPWLGDRRQMSFEGLRAAYQTARALQDDAGLSLVVGTLQSSDGSVIVRLSDHCTETVFPFVEGAAGHWGDQLPNNAGRHCCVSWPCCTRPPARSAPASRAYLWPCRSG